MKRVLGGAGVRTGPLLPFRATPARPPVRPTSAPGAINPSLSYREKENFMHENLQPVRLNHHPHVGASTLLMTEGDYILMSITRSHHLFALLFLDRPFAGSVDDKLNQRPFPPRVLLHLETTPQPKIFEKPRHKPVS